jgi:hypothetical protein
MASNLLKNTFLSTYKDDFRDSDNYHRILYNAARPLQARELTQSQTIIQREIERFARYIFNEGSLLTSSLGGLATKDFAINYVKLDTTTNPLPANYAELEGSIVTNVGEIASPVSARIRKVIPAEGADPATLFLEYVDGGDNDPINSTTPQIFRAGQDLTTTLGIVSVQSTNTNANPATGKGSLITVPQSEFFVLGHFVFVDKQSLVISKYDANPSAVIGYSVNESIITASDNVSLFDNQGSTPNLTSPGADRYQIRLTLTRQSDVSNTDTFIPIASITRGVAVALQNQDNVLSKLGDTIAIRTFEESGNYVVNGQSKFELQVLEDSDDDFLRYSIQPGVAYVKGRRVERTIPFNDLRVQKPRNDPGDIDRVTNENLAADYGTYFLADSMFGLVGGINTYSQVNLYDAENASGATLGTARVRSIDEVEDEYRVHVFNIAMDSNGSGSQYRINAVRSIGTSSINVANLIQDDNRTKLYNSENNTLLFSLPRGAPQELLNVTMTVGQVFSGTTNGSGEVLINTASVNDEFSDEDQWIIAYDSDGTIDTTLNIASGGAGTSQVQIDGLLANKNIKLLSYVAIGATLKTKILQSAQTETVSLTNGVFKLSKTDIFRFNSVVDASTGEDITYKFVFDSGQRDNFYDVGRGTLRGGFTAPSGNVTVNYDYFNHGSGDFFAANSYSNIDYEDIPFHVLSDGTRISLRNVIDLRSSKDTTGSNFTGTGASVLRIPRNRDLINIGIIDYWNPRVDQIYIMPDESINVLIGNSSSNPKPSAIPPESLLLHTIKLNAYTLNKSDFVAQRVKNTGYKMSDIRKIEERLSNLEEITTLTLSEQATNNISVIDQSGLERTKLGLAVDNFTNRLPALTTSLGHRAAIDKYEATLRPITIKRQVPLYYDSDASNGVRRYGDTIWPVFEEEVMISQTVASGPVNVNQFSLPKFVGSVEIKPEVDEWTIRKTRNRGTTTEVLINGDLSVYDTYLVVNKEG